MIIAALILSILTLVVSGFAVYLSLKNDKEIQKLKWGDK